MNRELLMEIAREKMLDYKSHRDREPGFVLRHGISAGKLAINMNRSLGLGLDEDIIYCSALFHDVGKGLEPHSRSGAALTREFLTGVIAEKQLDAVCRVIYTHCDREGGGELERLFRDADILDHIGTTEVWMTVAYCQNHGEGMDAFLDYYLNGKHKFWSESLRSRLFYPLSLEIFERRLAASEEFARRMKAQNEGLF